jgi:hypothetical protein
VIGAVILVARAATNTVINHPRSLTKSPTAIAHFEHVRLNDLDASQEATCRQLKRLLTLS